ncbi:MAG: histidine kinase N-terminal 7TM domain-containing protein [Myxococcota bacterium]
MFWEAGLILSIGVCAGIAVELLSRSADPSRRAAPALALCAALWCTGDLLLLHVESPEARLWARRVLFAGVCALGPCMLLVALRLRESHHHAPARSILRAACVVEAGIYGTLFTGASDLFISGNPADPARGPLFAVHALIQWSLIVWAIALLTGAALRVRGAGRLGAALVVAGAGLPLLLNRIHVGFGVTDHDPTSVALAVGALCLRFGLGDLVGAPYLAALVRSELLDQLDAGVLVADERGRVLEANSRARSLMPAIEPVGAPLGDLLAAFADDPGVDVRRFPLSRHGRGVGMGAIVNDRRVLRVAEKRAEVAARMEALGVLTRGLAREIERPLGVISAASAELRQGLSASGGARVEPSDAILSLDVLDEGGQRIADVVQRMQGLSDTSDLEDPGGARTEVRAVTDRAIALACLGKGEARVRLEAPKRPVEASVRATDLLQIVLHCVGNALESTSSGSVVRVRVEEDGDAVTLRILDDRRQRSDDVSRLFDPFYATRGPGGGLGLPLCWELARQNGGHLEALRRDTGGVEIRLTLPV